MSATFQVEEHVILDCDIGTDDAWALLSLIRAEQEKIRHLKILAVTCVAGNTSVDNVAVNAIRILETVNKLNIPVYKGCHQSILPKRENIEEKPDNKYFHGRDGFGDLCHEKEVDKSLIQKEHAVNIMYTLAKKYPKKITFILVGPLTNFANCINMYENFTENVKEIFIMGGNIQAVGNASPSAEFNFFMDPEAAHIVLEKSKCPITILPLETCLQPKFHITMDWRLKSFEKCRHAVIKMLNECEKKLYKKTYDLWNPCDAILTAAFLFPEKLIKTHSKWHATVELCGTYTRGQMILDHLKLGKKIDNVNIINEVHTEVMKDILLWTANL